MSAVLVGMKLGSFSRVVASVLGVPMRYVGVVTGLFVISTLVVFGSFTMVFCRVLVMLSRLVVVICAFVWHFLVTFQSEFRRDVPSLRQYQVYAPVVRACATCLFRDKWRSCDSEQRAGTINGSLGRVRIHGANRLAATSLALGHRDFKMDHIMLNEALGCEVTLLSTLSPDVSIAQQNQKAGLTGAELLHSTAPDTRFGTFSFRDRC